MSFLQEPTNWILFSFVIFVAGFLFKGLKIVLAKIDARIQDIKFEVETAEKLHAEAALFLADYQKRNANASNEAKEITDLARMQAEAMRAKAEADLKETMDRREKQLQDRLARIKQAAEAELRATTAQIALKASHALILKELDAKGHKALISKSIASLSSF